jgi:HlyD family secretion protein
MKNTSLPVKNITRPKRAVRSALAGALIGAALCLGACTRSNGGRAGDLVLSGNIEVTDAQLGFKVAGRVAERLVSEGDQVKAGQLVARLDDAEQKEQVALRRAELAGAEAALAELEAGSRPQEIAASEATLHSAEADRDRARLDFTRQQELRGKEAISDREFEAAQAQLKVAEARAVEAAEHTKLVQEGPRV